MCASLGCLGFLAAAASPRPRLRAPVPVHRRPRHIAAAPSLWGRPRLQPSALLPPPLGPRLARGLGLRPALARASHACPARVAAVPAPRPHLQPSTPACPVPLPRPLCSSRGCPWALPPLLSHTHCASCMGIRAVPACISGRALRVWLCRSGPACRARAPVPCPRCHRPCRPHMRVVCAVGTPTPPMRAPTPHLPSLWPSPRILPAPPLRSRSAPGAT